MIDTNKRKLETIGRWANIFSWVILIIQIAYAAWVIIMEIQSGSLASQNLLFSLFPLAVSLAGGIVSFITLQAISLGISILLELEEK